MTIETLRSFFLVCFLINWVFLIFWFVMFAFKRGWIYKMHSRWFKISEDQFDAIHYTGMAIYKLAFIIFNLVPYVALAIVG